MHLMLSNDDGIDAAGLHALRRAIGEARLKVAARLEAKAFDEEAGTVISLNLEEVLQAVHRGKQCTHQCGREHESARRHCGRHAGCGLTRGAARDPVDEEERLPDRDRETRVPDPAGASERTAGRLPAVAGRQNTPGTRRIAPGSRGPTAS